MQHALDAYGKVARKRFIDVVPMFCWVVLEQFPEKWGLDLAAILDHDLEKLLSSSGDDVSKRLNLKRKLAVLEEGLRIFEELFI